MNKRSKSNLSRREFILVASGEIAGLASTGLTPRKVLAATTDFGHDAVADHIGVQVRVDVSKQISIVPDLYGVGYDGWGDIIYPSAVKYLQGVGVKRCRVIAQLKGLCGDNPGDYRWDYTAPADMGLPLVAQVKKIIENGWMPIVAFSLHDGYDGLPKWFHGEVNDSASKAWFRYNQDGSLSPDGKGNQYEAITRISRDIVAKLAPEGLKGLLWETIYEMGAEMPLVDIHYHVAKGIRAADPTAKIAGPATWPGWTVEEKFVNPFLAKHGADLLDFVSLHWYGSNDHGLWNLGFKPDSDIITMADRKYLDYLMSMTPKYAEWTRTLKTLLDDRALNPTGKRIGIIYTEYDAVAQSPYGRNPENPLWPKYDPAADCYINTNYFGGVWCASALCGLAASGKADIVCKFSTRDYYGLIENGVDKTYFRQPVWFAWKMLQQAAGLKPGAAMLSANVTGRDAPSSLEAYAVRDMGGNSVIVINKSFEERSMDLIIRGLSKREWRVVRYVFDKARTANFIGRKPGSSGEGAFEGAPNGDSRNATSLRPVSELSKMSAGAGLTLIGVKCPPISVTVLTVRRGA